MENRILSIGLAIAGGILLTAALTKRGGRAVPEKGSGSKPKTSPAGTESNSSEGPAAPKKEAVAPIYADMIQVRLDRELYVNDRLCTQRFQRSMYCEKEMLLSTLLTNLEYFMPDQDTHSWAVSCQGKTIARLTNFKPGVWSGEMFVPDRLVRELPERRLLFHRLDTM